MNPYSYQDWKDYVATNYPGVVIGLGQYNAYVDRVREGDLREQDPGYVAPLVRDGDGGGDLAGSTRPTWGEFLADEGYTWQTYQQLPQSEIERQRLNYKDDYGVDPDLGDLTGLSGWSLDGDGDGDGGGGDVVDQNYPYLDEATGRWLDPLTGTYWGSEDAAWESYNAALESAGFEGELETAMKEYQAGIAKTGKSEAAEAQRLYARESGQARRMAREGWFAGGGAAGEFEQRFAGAEEAGARSLSDLVREINLETQRQQTGAQQFGIQGQMTAENLAQARRGMGMEQTRFRETLGQKKEQWQQNLAETMRQFNLGQQQQAGQFGQLYGEGGFYSQQLASQTRQWEEQLEQRKAEQPAWWEEPLSSAAGALPFVKFIFGCFDGSVPVITPDGLLPISLLKSGDMIGTPAGFKPVEAVHKYDLPATLTINGIKGRPHPFVMSNGSLEISSQLHQGDNLWGDIEVEETATCEGNGETYNLDVEGHIFYLGGDVLVHTGRDKNA